MLGTAPPRPIPTVATTETGRLQPSAVEGVLRAVLVGREPNGQAIIRLGGQLLQAPIPFEVPLNAVLSLRREGEGPSARLMLVGWTPPGGSEPSASAPFTRPMAPIAVATLPQGPLRAAVTALAHQGIVTGQVVTAGAEARITIGGHVVPASLPPDVVAGSQVALRLEPGPSTARLVLLSARDPAAPPTVPAAALATGPEPARWPQPALAEARLGALLRQDTVAGLAQTARQAAQQPQLPPAIRHLAQAIGARPLDFDRPAGVTGEALARAVAQSGVFMEARATAVAAMPRADVKTEILMLRGFLLGFLGAVAAEPQAARDKRPAPPQRGAVPRADASQLPPSPPQGGRETAHRLLAQTEQSLARIELLQMASREEDRAAPRDRAEWQVELPYAQDGRMGAMPLRILRDPQDDAPGAERGWHLQFAIDLSGLGEVGANIILRGRRISVALWAGEAATAALFEAARPELVAALEGEGLAVGTVVVRAGPPAGEPVHDDTHALDRRG